jgi:hypothetical protein
MAEAGQAGGKLNVFISYSRDDLDFADQLYSALGAFDFELSIDRHSIPGGDEWEKRLGALIRQAGTVVFVLSPSSAVSAFCAWEVEEAIRLGKRILPVVCRPLEGVKPPKALASLNYIFFCRGKDSPDSGWGTGLVQLTTALNTDLEWLREQTDYLRQATSWDAGDGPTNRLLSGGDIALAKAWAARRPANAPEPTPLQLDFIKASEAEEARRQNAEAKRLREIEKAVKSMPPSSLAHLTVCSSVAKTAVDTVSKNAVIRLRGRIINSLIPNLCIRFHTREGVKVLV